jgi:hypothetical protein
MNISGILLNQISGERLMEPNKGIINVQMATNISVVKMTANDDSLEFGFVFTVNYNPALATINIKGSLKVMGEKKELDDIKKAYGEKKTLPPPILQTISNIGFMESIMLSRSLNIPPPLPLPTINQQPPPPELSKSPSYIA